MEANDVSSQPVTFEMIDLDGNNEVTVEEFKAAEQKYGDSVYFSADLTNVLMSMEMEDLIQLAPPGSVDQGLAELYKILRELAEAEKDIDLALKDVARDLIEFFVQKSEEAAEKEKNGAIAAFALNMVAAAATIIVAGMGVRSIRKAEGLKGDSPEIKFQQQVAMGMSQLWTMTGSQAAGVVGSFSQPVEEIFRALASLMRTAAEEAKEQSNLTEAEQADSNDARKNLQQTLMELIKQLSDMATHVATA
jgi:hypothetical protein